MSEAKEKTISGFVTVLKAPVCLRTPFSHVATLPVRPTARLNLASQLVPYCSSPLSSTMTTQRPPPLLLPGLPCSEAVTSLLFS